MFAGEHDAALSPHLFEHAIVATVHAELLIRVLCARVALVDVKSNSTRSRAFRLFDDPSIELAIRAGTPEFRRDEDRLDPPDDPISPIAPFIGDHQLRGD